MQEKRVQQFVGLKGLILNNLNSIQSLIEQAAQLEDLAQTFKDTDDDKEQRQKLEKIIEGIYCSIKNLIERTNELFTEYDKICNNI